MSSKAGQKVFAFLALFLLAFGTPLTAAFAQQTQSPSDGSPAGQSSGQGGYPLPSGQFSAPAVPPAKAPAKSAPVVPGPSLPATPGTTAPATTTAPTNATPPAAGQAAPPPAVKLTNAKAPFRLAVAGQIIPIDSTLLQEKKGVVLLPIRPIAEGLLSDIEINPIDQTIKITRAEDRQVALLDAKKGTLSISGFSNGAQPNIDLIDWTPGREIVPTNLVELLLNVFISIDHEARIVNVNTNNSAFAAAIAEYAKEQAATPAGRFHWPVYKLNAVEYNNAMNVNSFTREGQTTTFRTTSQLGRTVINTYGTWLGSSKGPGWKYSIGGIDFINPSGYQLLMGDYVLKTGSLLATGFNHGFVGEKYWGHGTKLSFDIGKIQTRLTRIGLQTQRPLFERDNAMVFGTFDSADFLKSRHFRSPFWKYNHLIAGGGAGGFGDNRAAYTHGEALLHYAFARNAFEYFNGKWLGTTQFDYGLSLAKNELLTGTKRYRPGGVILFNQASTFFKRWTLTTLYERGSSHWTTLDTSNVFRNQTIFNENLSYKIFNGLNVFGSFGYSRPTDKTAAASKSWAGGGTLSPLPGILPEISATSNVQTQSHHGAIYFNTLFFNQPINVFRTRNNIFGSWLYSNLGKNHTMQSAFSLTERTTIWKSITTYWNRQWISPNTVNTQFGFDSGKVLGNYLNLVFGLGKAGTPASKEYNWNIGGNVFIPWIHQRIGFSYNQVSKSFQFRLNLQGFWGRPGVQLGQNVIPTQAIAPTGKIIGRFFVDNDLNGVYDPSADRPISNVRVIISNSVAAVTDQEGRYTVQNLPRGFVSVNTDAASIPASLAFITPFRQDVFILPNRTRTINFRFAKLSRLEGIVKAIPNPTETPVKDIRVYLEGTDRDTLTDELGHFSITDVPPGKYVLKLDPDYLQPTEQTKQNALSIDLKPGERLRGVEFVVEPREKQIEEKHF